MGKQERERAHLCLLSSSLREIPNMQNYFFAGLSIIFKLTFPHRSPVSVMQIKQNSVSYLAVDLNIIQWCILNFAKCNFILEACTFLCMCFTVKLAEMSPGVTVM